MFKKFIAALQIVKNREKIKAVLNGTYVAINKTLVALNYISEHTNDTKLGQLLQKNLPQIVNVLSKVKLVFEKFGPYVGLDLTVTEQKVQTEEVMLQNLVVAEKQLNELLK